MIKEFALDPEHLAQSDNPASILSLFDYSTGRMITGHKEPKKWLKMFAKYVSELPDDRKKLQLVEYLQPLITSEAERYSKFMPAGYQGRTEFNGTLDWINATLEENSKSPRKFAGIISDKPGADFDVYGANDRNPAFLSSPTIRVRRRLELLFQALEPILAFSDEITLVDPYLNPSHSNYVGILDSLKLVSPHIVRVRVICGEAGPGCKYLNIGDLEVIYKRHTTAKDVTVEINQVRDGKTSAELHDRFIYNKYIGVEVNPGIQQTNDQRANYRVKLLSLKDFLNIKEIYNDPKSFFYIPNDQIKLEF